MTRQEFCVKSDCKLYGIYCPIDDAISKSFASVKWKRRERERLNDYFENSEMSDEEAALMIFQICQRTYWRYE